MKSIIILFSLLLLIGACETSHEATPSGQAKASLTINRRFDLENMKKLSLSYLYTASYNQEAKFLSGPQQEILATIESVDLSLFDISFYGKDTTVLSFQPSLGNTRLEPSPKVDTQVIFSSGKVIGIGSGDSFSFFAENPSLCQLVVKNYEALKTRLNTKKDATGLSNWLLNNSSELIITKGMSTCF